MGAILSFGMLCRHSLDWPQLAGEIDGAVGDVLARGLRTADLGDGGVHVGTREFGECAAQRLEARLAVRAGG